MSYATRDELATRVGADALPQIENASGDLVEDTARISAALQDASALIDSYLAKQYTLPLAKVSAVVRSLTLDIARYRLASDVLEASDPALQTYKTAIAFLEKMAAGGFVLKGATQKTARQKVYATSKKKDNLAEEDEHQFAGQWLGSGQTFVSKVAS